MEARVWWREQDYKAIARGNGTIQRAFFNLLSFSDAIHNLIASRALLYPPPIFKIPKKKK
jgi:hypothetical protein